MLSQIDRRDDIRSHRGRRQINGDFPHFLKHPGVPNVRFGGGGVKDDIRHIRSLFKKRFQAPAKGGVSSFLRPF